MDLGPDEPQFRAYLLGQTPFPADASLVVTLFDPAKSTLGLRVDRSFCTYKSTRIDGVCRLHRFTILGVDMALFVGRAQPPSLIEASFPRSGLVAVLSADSYAMQLARVQGMYRPKGSLAARPL